VSDTASPTTVELPAHEAVEKREVPGSDVSTDRLALLALAGVLLVAGTLRVVGSGYGLPYPLLNPDEASIVPRAWAVVHGGGLDPGWYDYPSLLMELVAPFQAPFDDPSYGAARAVAVAIGLLGVAAAWWLGRRAYGNAAGLVGAAAVAVATSHVAYSRMAVTDVLLTLGVTVALALAVAGKLELAGLAAGLAASAKYPGVVLVVPLLVAGWGHWRRLAVAAGLSFAAFALTSPFVLLNVDDAWDDISRVQRLARAGWLGFEDEPATPLAFLDRLWEALGPFLVLALAGIVLAVLRRRRADLVLVSFAISYWLYLMPLEAHFDRYVLPLVPVLGVLAGSLRAAVPVALVLLAVPLAWAIGDTAELTETDARLRADAWIAANVPRGERIAADPSTLPLRGRPVLRLRLPGPGQPQEPRRDLTRLRAEGVRWVLVSGAVTDRVLAARDRYPIEASFYDALSRTGELRFRAGPELDGLAGPWVRVYRL
jgi:4-amino-4-deoxy-L-arabinose transferase-like glycosyltransferase